MHICLFEDDSVYNLEPLSYTRPVYDLFCGTSTLKEKILRNFPSASFSLHCREYLKDIVSAANPNIPVNEIPEGECLFINGRIIANGSLKIIFEKGTGNKAWYKGNFLAAARVDGKSIGKPADAITSKQFENLDREEIDLPYVEYIWDLIYANKSLLISEIKEKINSTAENINGIVYNSVSFIDKEKVYIGEGAQVKPGVVIDASGGPVYIGKNCTIFPNSVIEGPVYIGDNSLIKSCSKIYGGVSIGYTCKIGGEVEDSIIMAFSNKQHDGFLGHAYLGSWVNLGADTNCSDLRNNYGPVRAYVNGKEINSGRQFLGLIMGDHSKTAINTMFNTGTVVGISCNIFGAGFPDKSIPSFSWGGNESMVTYDAAKSIETARIVMGRRNRKLTEADEKMFNYIHGVTAEERIKKGYNNN